MAKRTPDEYAYIAHGKLNVPVSIYFERRRNTRISIGSDSVHLRLPKNLSKKEFNDQLAWAEKWLHRRLEKAPVLLERFKTIFFRHGDRIRIMNDVYVIHISSTEKKAASATLKNQDIFIGIPSALDIADRNKSIQSLTHKLLCQRYIVFIKSRVRELNEQFFRQPYGRVQLKHINSKWGSCSSSGDIVLSSKLLLCPDWIRDYVIIHELAHLIEHNHSPAFWQLVADAMPSYEKAENWLDTKGIGLEIRPMQYQHRPPTFTSKLTLTDELKEPSPQGVKVETKSREQISDSINKADTDIVSQKEDDSSRIAIPQKSEQFHRSKKVSEPILNQTSTLFPNLIPTEESAKKPKKKRATKRATASDGSEQLKLF